MNLLDEGFHRCDTLVELASTWKPEFYVTCRVPATAILNKSLKKSFWKQSSSCSDRCPRPIHRTSVRLQRVAVPWFVAALRILENLAACEVSL